ncbi:MAG: helix-turn-helix domain-containing protein, partial [Pseudomonadota bacterium]
MGEPTRRAMAVEAAREVFWARGYEDASIADIIEASGLNRYAIYAEFEGKRELFLACLADFVAERRARIAPILFDAARPPLARLRRAFHMMIDEMLSDRRGCLMSQTAIEVARDDPVIRDQPVYTQQNARYWITSEDEWYKAAYHNALAGTAGVYFD